MANHRIKNTLMGLQRRFSSIMNRIQSLDFGDDRTDLEMRAVEIESLLADAQRSFDEGLDAESRIKGLQDRRYGLSEAKKREETEITDQQKNMEKYDADLEKLNSESSKIRDEQNVDFAVMLNNIVEGKNGEEEKRKRDALYQRADELNAQIMEEEQKKSDAERRITLAERNIYEIEEEDSGIRTQIDELEEKIQNSKTETVRAADDLDSKIRNLSQDIDKAFSRQRERIERENAERELTPAEIYERDYAAVNDDWLPAAQEKYNVDLTREELNKMADYDYGLTSSFRSINDALRKGLGDIQNSSPDNKKENIESALMTAKTAQATIKNAEAVYAKEQKAFDAKQASALEERKRLENELKQFKDKKKSVDREINDLSDKSENVWKEITRLGPITSPEAAAEREKMGFMERRRLNRDKKQYDAKWNENDALNRKMEEKSNEEAALWDEIEKREAAIAKIDRELGVEAVRLEGKKRAISAASFSVQKSVESINKQAEAEKENGSRTKKTVEELQNGRENKSAKSSGRTKPRSLTNERSDVMMVSSK